MADHEQTATRENDEARSEERYDFAAIQDKWTPVWEALKPFATDDPADKRPRKYVLDRKSVV